MRKAAISMLAAGMAGVAVVLVGLSSTSAQPAGAGGSAEEPAVTMRVGTYDNRAVTIAWFHSEFNDRTTRLHERMNAAREAGDQATIDELSELAPKLQRKLHFQGFGRAPVTDLLEPVKDRLGEAAAAAGVDAIVFECNYARAGVEVMDVTDEVVKLFDPTTEALHIIEELKKHDPVPLEDLKDEH